MTRRNLRSDFKKCSVTLVYCMRYQVYDVSSYVTAHPGQEAILRNVGGDSTEGFKQQAAHRVVKNHIASLLDKFYVGLLETSENSEPS